jgi:hypothetical protein
MFSIFSVNWHPLGKLFNPEIALKGYREASPSRRNITFRVYEQQIAKEIRPPR